MSETEAAAERVRRIRNGELQSVVYDYVPGGYLSSNREDTNAAYSADLISTSDAYLAEHPADDATPLDEAWLGSVGERMDDDLFHFKNECGIEFFVWLVDGDNGGPTINFGDIDHRMPIKARGTVRSLASVLGIPLTGDVQ